MGEHLPCATTALHRSEGGVRELHHTASAATYAAELARYIASPSTVRVRTLEQFGQAPSLDRIRVMRARHVAAREAFRREADTLAVSDNDAMDFRVSAHLRVHKNEHPEPPRVQFKETPELLDPKPKTGPEIIAAIARDFGFTVAEIKGPGRRRNICLARATCVFVLRMRGNSYSVIGRWLGRDHSTVINSHRQFEALATPAMWALAESYIGERA